LVRCKGGFIFALVVDPLLNEHRVHKDCLADALGDGIAEVKRPAPAEPGRQT
jgi:hypothetical protein